MTKVNKARFFGAVRVVNGLLVLLSSSLTSVDIFVFIYLALFSPRELSCLSFPAFSTLLYVC